MEQVLHLLRPGTVIVAEGPMHDGPWPTLCDVQFEPVPVTDDSEELQLLVRQNFESGGISAFDFEGPVADNGIRARLQRWISSPFGKLIREIALAGLLGKVLFHSDWCTGALLSFGLLSWVYANSGLVVTDDWWIVPGGLAYREQRPWKRHVHIQLFAGKTTPLLLNLREFKAQVHDGNATRTCSLTGLSAWLLIASWTSVLRSPTSDELSAVLNSDQSPRD
jgi:hypothetical protein